MTPPSGGGASSARASDGPAASAQSMHPTAREWSAQWGRVVTDAEFVHQLAARAQAMDRWEDQHWEGWRNVRP